MQHIDESRLETDLAYRYEYLTNFIGFTEEDVAAIHASADHLAPLVPALVDAVYEKLFTQDATNRHFLPKQHGYDGPVPEDLESLTLDHPQIAFRKGHLTKYFTKLVAADYDASFVKYLNGAGKMHTATGRQ